MAVSESRRKVDPDLGTTAAIAEFAATAVPPPRTVAATERVILDTVACAVGGFDTEPGRVLAAFRRSQGGRADSSLVVTGERLPAGSAAFVNAQLANILDADETLLNFNHFACAIVMPAIAVAELTGASGHDTVSAVAVGFDVAARVGLGLRDLETTSEGDITRTAGSGVSWAALGTAAACGRLLGLNSERIAHAIGLAYVTAPLHGCLVNYVASMGQRPSPWHKYAMYGSIAEAGVNAAGLAATGFMGDPGILDRGSEFYRPLGGTSFDWELLIRELGGHWWIEETSLKPYPFCRYGHSALDLLSRIVRDEDLARDEIDCVTITIPPFPPLETIASTFDPGGPLDIMSSLPFASALVAERITPGPRWWDKDHLESDELRTFSRKVRYRVNPALRSVLADQVRSEEGKFRAFPVEVEVAARGRKFVAASEFAKGDPWSVESVLSDDDLAAKVLEYCTGAVGKERAEGLVDASFGLDAARDVTAIVSGMTTPASD